ncbi:major_cap_HK97, phage major capsid protein, HK97 family [uncultured Caudovirales phage]|uniref:Major_cap_HK97, phage major capsid protein, HK97 family n=1 Tax=uncultured Caudovirales phage TaxID=2100421 RepID=A0A6J5PVF0_9CAUD|nr:major_cap_HK97, phage major capsid protein, HK97 family [uncultured Caudovirales phage]CAB4203266.1 major_cap_HK97, phage major capsid protein, HK97 family [uncultured Caudovirales phage]
MLDEADMNLPKGLTAEDVDHLARKHLVHGETRMGHAELRALGEQSQGTSGNANIQEGFYLAPSKFSSECVYRIRALNPFRAGGAKVFKNCGYSLTLPVVATDIDATIQVRTDVTASGGDGGIVMAEYSATPKFGLPSRSSVDPPPTVNILYPKPRYVYIRVSRELLEDTSENNGVALEKLLGNMAAQAFVDREMTDLIRGNGTTDVTTDRVMGIVPQLAACLRSSAALGTVAGSITSTKLSLVVETLTSGRFARAIWMMHPRMLGIFNATVDAFFYSNAVSTDADGNHHTCMSMYGRPLYTEPLMLTAAALTAGTRPGMLIDPSAVVIAESGPPVALRRLDELGAGTNEVLFQAVRRYDSCLADVTAATALLL